MNRTSTGYRPLLHGGATGRDIAETDWSRHPLGDRSNWSATFRLALNMVLNSGFPSYLLWGKEFFVFYNDAYVPILGNKVALGQGRPLAELWSEIAESACLIAERAFAGESTYFKDRPFILKRNGQPEQTFFTFSFSPVPDESDKIAGVLCTIVETTDTVSALARLKDSEERLRLSLDASGTIGTWSYDPENNLTVVDDRFARLFQVDAALAQGGTQLERFTNMIHPDDRERVIAAISHAIRTGEPYDTEYRIPQLSGKIIWVGAKGGMFVDVQTGERRFAGVAVDVTDRKNADEALRSHAARQAFQLQLADHIRPLTSPDEIIDVTSALLGQHMGVSRVLYAEIDDANATTYVRSEWTAHGFRSLAGQTIEMDEFGPDVVADLRAASVVVNDDVELDWRTSDYVDAYAAISVRADLLVPLVKSGKLKVVLTLQRSEPFRWKAEDIQLAKETAESTWLAVEAARARAELRIERDLIRSIFDSMTEGFALLDHDWTILKLNETGAQLCQRPLHELIGHNHWDVMKETIGTPMEALYRQVRQTRETATLEHYHQPPSGKNAWIEIRVYPLNDGRLAIFFRDITERKKIEQELSTANRRKDEFLAMLAHELRNPLAPIRAAADLLLVARTDEARIKRTSAIISRQVSHMTSLIDDLLDVSRVTRGLVTLEVSELDAKRIVSDAVEQVRPLIESRGHHFAVQITPEPVHVFGDHKRLVQVLTNLLNNAAKYTPEGGNISLELKIRDQQVVLVVTDDGIGMSPDMAERAFELFAQAERTSDRAQGGLGLGLALVKSLIELHHGTVTATSNGEGAGSKFAVYLPRVDRATRKPAHESKPDVAMASKPLRVLIVDDNADAGGMLGMFLEACGHDVVVECGARSALERARSDAPDVCLLDIGLPDMDGNELARRLRSQSETKNSILIAVTRYWQESDRKSTAAAGFDHHFVKPLATAELAALLTTIEAR